MASRDLRGVRVTDAHGLAVGTVQGALVDPSTRTVSWLRLQLAEREVMVPADAAHESTPGELVVPWTRAELAAAPPAGPDEVSTAQAAALHRHFGFGDAAPGPG